MKCPGAILMLTSFLLLLVSLLILNQPDNDLYLGVFRGSAVALVVNIAAIICFIAGVIQSIKPQ